MDAATVALGTYEPERGLDQTPRMREREMLDKTILGYYRRFRTASPFVLVGHNARLALDSAKTLARFQELEAQGYVRLTVEFDDDCDTSWMDERQREAWDGEAYVTRTEYRLPMPEGYEYDDDDAGWNWADAVGGHIGYRDPSDPFENPYVIDEMAEAIRLFEQDGMRLATFIERRGLSLLTNLVTA